jgi:hypothetical protein
VCVSSLRYPPCKAHAPYCHLWPARLYSIFPHFLINGRLKKLLNIKCVFWFSLWNNLHIWTVHQQYQSTFFIIPADVHNYKIIGKLKTIKIPTTAPTCFGSRRNHHQGAISCLAKTTIMILLCSSLMTRSMLWWHTSLLCISWKNKKVLLSETFFILWESSEMWS